MATVEEFAAELAGVINDAVEHEPERFKDCRSWVDLNSVCDANDFIQSTVEELGLSFDTQFDLILKLSNEAVPLAEQQVWGAR